MNVVTFDQHLGQYGDLTLREVSDAGRDAGSAASETVTVDDESRRLAKKIVHNYVVASKPSVVEQAVTACAGSVRVGARLARIERNRGWCIGPQSIDARIWRAMSGLIAGMQAELQRKGWHLDDGPSIRALSCMAGYAAEREGFDAVARSLDGASKPLIHLSDSPPR